MFSSWVSLAATTQLVGICVACAVLGHLFLFALVWIHIFDKNWLFWLFFAPCMESPKLLWTESEFAEAVKYLYSATKNCCASATRSNGGAALALDTHTRTHICSKKSKLYLYVLGLYELSPSSERIDQQSKQSFKVLSTTTWSRFSAWVWTTTTMMLYSNNNTYARVKSNVEVPFGRH